MLARFISVVAVAMAVWGQSPNAQPAFEAASLKASSPTGRFSPPRGGPGTSSPGQYTATNLPLQTLILTAWKLSRFQLNGPASLNNEQYDIAVKIPPGTTVEQFNLMLQRLLKERLGLVVHRESKEMQVYNLVVTKEGLKMQEAAPPTDGVIPPDPEASSPPGQTPTVRMEKDKRDGKLQLPAGRKMAVVMGVGGGVARKMARMQEMSDIAEFCEARAGRPVIDKTGVTGQFDYVLEFVQDNLLPAASRWSSAGATNSSPGVPSEGGIPAAPFMIAIVEQLGLKLEPAKASVDILVVDQFNKIPAEN